MILRLPNHIIEVTIVVCIYIYVCVHAVHIHVHTYVRTNVQFMSQVHNIMYIRCVVRTCYEMIVLVTHPSPM